MKVIFAYVRKKERRNQNLDVLTSDMFGAYEKLCTRCGENPVFLPDRRMIGLNDWCEKCLWEYVQEENE